MAKRKIHRPDAKELSKDTAVVLGTVIAVSLVLSGIQLGIGELLLLLA